MNSDIQKGEGNNNFCSKLYDQPTRTPAATMRQPKIINLSGFEITEIQETVLFKGLKFTPTPRRNAFKLQSDNHKFNGKLRFKKCPGE